MSFNKLIVYGNVGKDPELRYTSNGTPVCNFSLATSEKRGDKETTTWFRVTFFGKQAEVASQYLQKGKSVYIEGRVTLDKYIDRDGKERQSLEVFGTELKLMDKRGGEGQSYQRSGYDQTRKGTEDHNQRVQGGDADDDTIPF